MPYFTSLADKYAMSDNFHQSVNGGTGANHIMFGHADAIWFSNADGSPGKPPQNTTVFSTYNGAANPDKGVVQEIENPNPARAPTTGTPRTATASATTPATRRPTRRSPFPAAARTATAPTRPRPA